MNTVAVTSRSFSQHESLRKEINKNYSTVSFNETGKTLVGEDLIQFLQGHEKAIIGLERLDENVLQHLPDLKVISRFGVGLDSLDLNAIRRLGIRLAYTAGANKRSVAELVISFAISMLRHIPQLNQELQAGLWRQRKGRQLSGKTVGILGLGAVGRDLAYLLKIFDCELLAYDLLTQREFCATHNIKQLSLEEVLGKSDIISLHLPYTQETKQLLNQQRLELLSTEAILINTARGGLVDEDYLYHMLSQKRIAAAAFDVFNTEPEPNKKLLSLANFFATPHIGGSTEEAILAMGKAAINGLETAELL